PGGEKNKKDDAYAALEKQSPQQRAAISEAFHELTGGRLEDWIKEHYSEDAQEKALNYLKYGDRDESAKLHLGLSKHDGNQVRFMITMMGSKDIEQLQKDYLEHYGTSLDDALMSDPSLSNANKAALKIYLKGRDQISDADRATLLDISLH